MLLDVFLKVVSNAFKRFTLFFVLEWTHHCVVKYLNMPKDITLIYLMFCWHPEASASELLENFKIFSSLIIICSWWAMDKKFIPRWWQLESRFRKSSTHFNPLETGVFCVHDIHSSPSVKREHFLLILKRMLQN